MANYMVLFRFTPKGIENIRDAQSRLEDAKEVFRQAGAEVKEFYALMGRYDTMMMVDAPDDASLAKALYTIDSKGNVQSETLRAFTEREFIEMVSSLEMAEAKAYEGESF